MAGEFSMRVTGTEQLTRVLNRIKNESPSALAAALYQEAELIMGDSKENYVPVDTGTLRESGHVQLPRTSIIGNNTIIVNLGYGGAAADYAVYVHEVNARHEVGEWKYLETPMNNAARGLGQRLATRAAKWLARFGH